MGELIHPLSVVDARAKLHDGVKIGPFAVVGPNVEIGEDSEIGASANVSGWTTLGRENRVFPHACIGFEPQDLKFEGEESTLEIGDRNVIREFCTFNLGTEFGGGTTRVGSLQPRRPRFASWKPYCLHEWSHTCRARRYWGRRYDRCP